MNWDDTQYLLALGREKTLRKAAQQLYVDQATVGRRIAILKNSLKCQLFIRSNKGYEFTPAGYQAFLAAIEMEQAALTLQNKVKGFDQQLKGDITLSTTDSIAIDFIINAIKQLRTSAPEIRIKLDVTTALRDMTQHNIDIAIRNIRPDTPGLVTKLLLTSPMGLYSSSEYLHQHGYPKTSDSLAGLDLIVHAPMVEKSPDKLFGLAIDKAKIALLADSSLLLRTSIKNGVGIGFLPKFMADIDNLVPIFPEKDFNSNYEIWLVTHADIIHTARIQMVLDTLSQLFSVKAV
ncbi:LysR family transcriptional regulator [Photobacterium leiognathi]|uniref:LysR family transcriptional regulator n=1 Tax=Photobacterium leiognathi TaxID=553611 RepID=UPI002736C053|nr:LysR family transcriptional regulator [Photobacterium leiognathi]